MANIAYQRLQREFKEVVSNQEVSQTGIKLETMDDSFSNLRGEIRGPPDTPYSGGIFELAVIISDAYPFKPPQVKFVSKLWHPNVSSQTGAICLDVLKDQWAASMTLRTVLLSVQSLLSVPEPSDPQDAVVARQCIENRQLFAKTALFWAQEYANAPGDKCEDMQIKINTLVDMGITREAALRALSSTDWDLATATERVFS